jgi:hypothetical protein
MEFVPAAFARIAFIYASRVCVGFFWGLFWRYHAILSWVYVDLYNGFILFGSCVNPNFWVNPNTNFYNERRIALI